MTDTPASELRGHVGLVLPVARGRADLLSMPTATLGLIKAILVAVAAKRPEQMIASPTALNEARAGTAGSAASLIASHRRPPQRAFTEMLSCGDDKPAARGHIREVRPGNPLKNDAALPIFARSPAAERRRVEV